MQCTCKLWSSVVFPSKLTATNSQSKLSIAQMQNLDDTSTDVKFTLPYHVKSITSTSNPFVKHCVKLRHCSSYRHSHGSVLVVGSTPIREIYRFHDSLQETTIAMECLLLLDEAEIPEGIDGISIRVVRVSSMVMKKISGLQSIESIDAIGIIRIPTSYSIIHDSRKEVDFRRWFPSPHRLLVLDGIQDPGNLGTLLRSAVAFRWNGVFLLPGCCDPFNEKALRASRGASFQLPLVSGTWTHLETFKTEFQMKMLAGHPDTNEESKPIFSLSPNFANSLADLPLCLVLGSEGTGLSEKSWTICELVSIPMAGDFESLNVSVAGGIFLYMLQPKNRRFS